MYLEISGQQSGKTERLVKEAIHHAARKGVSIMVVPTTIVAEKLETKYPTIEVVPVTRLQKFVDARGGYIALLRKKARFFFDDFDSYLVDVPLHANGYYATTPARLRHDGDEAKRDFLMKLVQSASVKKIPMHNFRNSDFGAEFKVKHKGCTNRDVIYQTQVLGRYHKRQLV